MTCPYCKREFPFNNGELDKKIEALKQDYTAVELELSKIKAMHYQKRREMEGRRKVLVERKNEIAKKLVELKTVRKATDQQIRAYEYQLFKNIVKEKYGEVEYRKIYEQVAEELKAYKVSGLMRHEYTRSNAKANVTSINKL